jgi:hypothetical protein
MQIPLSEPSQPDGQEYTKCLHESPT